MWCTIRVKQSGDKVMYRNILLVKGPVKWFQFIKLIKVYITMNNESHNLADYFSSLIISYFQK